MDHIKIEFGNVSVIIDCEEDYFFAQLGREADGTLSKADLKALRYVVEYMDGIRKILEPVCNMYREGGEE